MIRNDDKKYRGIGSSYIITEKVLPTSILYKGNRCYKLKNNHRHSGMERAGQDWTRNEEINSLLSFDVTNVFDCSANI